MPCANQLDMIWLDTPDPSRRSPSVEMIQREQESSFFRARINCQIRAIGVRDMVEPPMPTEVPSCHKGRSLLQRDHLLAKAAVPPRQILPQRLIRLHPVPSHHHDLALPALAASFEPEASALKSSISASHSGQARGDVIPK